MRQSPGAHGRIAFAVLAIVIAAAALITSERAGAADAARRAPRSTHVNASIANFVLLQLVDEATDPKFVRVHPDATRGTDEFVVPEGNALVITGYDLVTDWLTGSSIQCTTRFWVRNVATGTRNVVLHRQSEAWETRNSPDGYFTRHSLNDSLTTGVVLGPGTALDVDGRLLGAVDNGFNSGAFTSYGNYEITVRGYLTSSE